MDYKLIEEMTPLKNRGMKFRTWIPSDNEIIVSRVA